MKASCFQQRSPETVKGQTYYVFKYFHKAMWKFNTGIRFEAYGYIFTKIYCKALWIHFLHFLDKEWYLTHLKNLKNWKISKENKFVLYLNISILFLKKTKVDVFFITLSIFRLKWKSPDRNCYPLIFMNICRKSNLKI